MAFLGDGRGGFREETIDAAPHPGWGSSGLSLVDLDRDGDLDALVTNGDMLDDFQVKPYHGIRWLENRGSFPWVPHAIADLPGVERARAVDLDGDGDLDVVACCLRAAAGGERPGRAPRPGVARLARADGARAFVRHTLERGGRHVSLDVADYDGDGDVDLVGRQLPGRRATSRSRSGRTSPESPALGPPAGERARCPAGWHRGARAVVPQDVEKTPPPQSKGRQLWKPFENSRH